MSGSTTRLYASLLASSNQLPEGLLRAVFQSACRADDLDLIAALAERPDLPADVVDHIGQMSQPRIVSIYRARPSRPDQVGDRIIETRASVRARSLKGTKTGAEAFADAINGFEVKQTDTLRDALLRLPARWFTARQAATLLSNARFQPRQRQLVTDLVARLGTAEVANALLRQDGPLDTDVVIALAHHNVDMTPLIEAASKSLHATEKIGQHWVEHMWDSPYQMISDVLNRASDKHELTDAADALLEAARSRPWGSDLAVRRVHTAMRKNRYPLRFERWDETPATAPLVTTGFDNAPIVVVRAAAASSDPGVLHQVVRRVLRDAQADNLDPEAARQLLRNLALTGQDLDTLLAGIDALAPTTQYLDMLAQLDVIVVRGDNPQAVAVWCHQFPVEVLTAHGWAPFGGQANAVKLVNEWIGRLPVLRSMMAAAFTAGLTDEQLREVDMAGIRELIAPSHKVNLGADAVGRILAEDLDSDHTAWLVFEELSASFTGTLGELVNSARLVSQ